MKYLHTMDNLAVCELVASHNTPDDFDFEEFKKGLVDSQPQTYTFVPYRADFEPKETPIAEERTRPQERV